jgi:ribulose 1,5-bisphosphate synthetase/thiazole synthase
MSHANAISVNNSTSLAERVHVGGLVRARAAVEQLHRHVDRRAFEAGPVVRRHLHDAGLVGCPWRRAPSSQVGQLGDDGFARRETEDEQVGRL